MFANSDLTFVGVPPPQPPPNPSNNADWTGRVRNGLIVFTTNDFPGLEPIEPRPPSSSELFENNFTFCVSGLGEPNSLQQNSSFQILGTLCTAFNRSVMLTTTNRDAKAIHANSIDGLAYAFQSDDHCDGSSFVSALNPTVLTITFVDSVP